MKKLALAGLTQIAVMACGNVYADVFFLSCIYDSPPYMRGRSLQVAVEEKSQSVMLGDGGIGEKPSINSLRIAFKVKAIFFEVDRLSGRFMTTGDKFPGNGSCAVVQKPKF